MARNITTRRKVVVSVVAWVIAILIFFPILWTFLTSFKSEGDAIASPPQFLFFHWTLENYFEVQIALELFPSLRQLGPHRLRFDDPRFDRCRSGCLGHGIFSDQAHQGCADVDAVHQDDAAGRCLHPDLPAVPAPSVCSTISSPAVSAWSSC